MKLFRLKAAATACAVGLILLPAIAYANDTVELRYKAKVGEKSIYQSSLTTEVNQTINGQDVDTTFEQSDVTTYTVKKIAEDGTIIFETQNERLKVEGNFAPQVTFKFDSQSDDNDSTSQIGAAVTPLYERLSGAILGVEVTPLGKVKKVNGYTQLLQDVLKDNPIAQRFAGGGSEEAVLSNIQDLFVLFKKEPVKAGEKWDKPYKIKLPGLGEFEGKRTYTFVGPDKVGEIPTLRITIDTDLTGDLDIDMGTAKVSGKFETDSSSGTVQFDPASGRILSMDSEQTFSGDLTVEAGGMTIPVNFSQTLKNTRKLVDKIPE